MGGQTRKTAGNTYAFVQYEVPSMNAMLNMKLVKNV